MKSLHDCEILSYLVDLKNSKIIMKILAEDSTKVKIKFTEVLAHNFSNQLNGSIILDLEISDVELFIEENKEILNEGKSFCWPVDYSDVDDLRKILQIGNYKYFILSASYGLSGWIIAKEMSVCY